MNTPWPWLAQTTLPRDILTAPWGRMSASTRELMAVLTAVGIVTVALVFWAAFVRKRRRPYWRRHRHHHSYWQPNRATASNGEAAARARHKRRRRRHREERPRNPTLAETGGLPPARPPTPPESWP